MRFLRVLLPIVMFLGLATWALGVPDHRLNWPDVAVGEELITTFSIDDAAIGDVSAVPRCAGWSVATGDDRLCTVLQVQYFVPRDLTVTRVSIVTGEGPFTLAEGCDVSLYTATAPGGTHAALAGTLFQMGSAEVGRAVGDSLSITGLSLSVSAGASMVAAWEDPEDPGAGEYCASEASATCVCSAQDGSYQYAVFGHWK